MASAFLPPKNALLSRRAQALPDMPSGMPATGQLPRQPQTYRRSLYVILVVLLLLSAAVASILLFVPFPTDCKLDKNCFMAAAQACKPASLTIIDDRGKATLESRDCTITKTLTRLDAAAPEMEEYLVGQSMMCSYTQGNAPHELVIGITSDASGCEGELERRLQLIAATV
ncbi:MAG: hypothetical protein AABY13_00365 [Nanoarchaeota archaeon]